MTEETVATTTPADVDRQSRRHALSGLLATGAFLLELLFTQVPALRGADAWDRIGGAIERSNLLVFFEIVFVLVPFAYHLAVGAKITPRLARITGVLLGVFFVVHFCEFPAQRGFFGLTAEGALARMTAHFSRTWAGVPLLALLEITGIGLTCLHFAIGLLAVGRSRVQAIALGAASFVVASASVVGLATGSALLPPPSLPDAACGSAVEMPAH